MIDGESHRGFGGGRCLEVDEEKIVAVSENVYPGVDFERNVSFEERGFRDRFTVRAPKPVSMDFFFHIEGELMGDYPVLKGDLGFRGEGYQHLSDLREIRMEGEKALLSWNVGGLIVDSLIDRENSRLFTAISPDNSERGFRRTMVIRRIARETTFDLLWRIRDKE